MKFFFVSAVACAAVLLHPHVASACASCYGPADNSTVQGMNMAVMGMLGILGMVLTSFIAFFLMLRKRSKLFAGDSANQSSMFNEGNL